MSNTRFWLVVPAAGIGQRMQADRPKQYLRIQNRYLLDITLTRLLAAADFDGCIVALHGEDHRWPHTDSASDDRIRAIQGGAQRSDSVMAALRTLDSHATSHDWVLVHDVARPCLHADDLKRLRKELQGHPVGGLLACPVADTLKRMGPGQTVIETVERDGIWRALTPQMFRYGVLRDALAKAEHAGLVITDEASAVEHYGFKPRLVEGRADNIKVTVPEDLALAELILSRIENGTGITRGDP